MDAALHGNSNLVSQGHVHAVLPAHHRHVRIFHIPQRPLRAYSRALAGTAHVLLLLLPGAYFNAFEEGDPLGIPLLVFGEVFLLLLFLLNFFFCSPAHCKTACNDTAAGQTPERFVSK
jgi:hypothetical protein